MPNDYNNYIYKSIDIPRTQVTEFRLVGLDEEPLQGRFGITHLNMNLHPTMPEKFKNKYRIASARLQSWDYRSNGAYFLTICTAGRENYFGSIKNREMVLAPIGRIAHEFWMEIPGHFPFVVLDAFVVMPNHTHGIIIIDRGNQRFRNIDDIRDIRRDVACNVSTHTTKPMNTTKPTNSTKPTNTMITYVH
jgi:REP element-mobilizing transposase RayT